MIEISSEEIFNINTYNKNNLFYNNWIKVLMAAERSISELPAQLIWKLSNENDFDEVEYNGKWYYILHH